MRIQLLREVSNEEATRVYKWHDWFAWRPVVTLDGELVWWEVVERMLWVDTGTDPDSRWKYRLKSQS